METIEQLYRGMDQKYQHDNWSMGAMYGIPISEHGADARVRPEQRNWGRPCRVHFRLEGVPAVKNRSINY